MYTCIHVCMYIRIYMYIYLYVCICTCMYYVFVDTGEVNYEVFFFFKKIWFLNLYWRHDSAPALVFQSQT